MPQQGLFKRKPAPQPEPDRNVLEVTRRSRMLEQRYSNLERRSQVIEENMLEHHRKLSSEIKMLNEDLADVKKAIAELNEKIQHLASDMQDFARKEDVQVIKKYLDYWNPLNFVTQKQAEKIAREIADDKKEK